jgi:hypothetical protein
MLNAILSGLILSFISALAFLAYRHQQIFSLIKLPLLIIALVVFVSIMSYNYGISVAQNSLPFPKSVSPEDHKAIYDAIGQKQVDSLWPWVFFGGFNLYILVLSLLSHLVAKEKEHGPNNPHLEKKDQSIS